MLCPLWGGIGVGGEWSGGNINAVYIGIPKVSCHFSHRPSGGWAEEQRSTEMRRRSVSNRKKMVRGADIPF